MLKCLQGQWVIVVPGALINHLHLRKIQSSPERDTSSQRLPPRKRGACSEQIYASGMPSSLQWPFIKFPLLTVACFISHWRQILFEILYKNPLNLWSQAVSSLYLLKSITVLWAFPNGSSHKGSVCNAGDADSIPRLGRFPWGRKWQPTLVFLPGESHGQRSWAGYSPWGHKESDMTEHAHTSLIRIEKSIPSSHAMDPWALKLTHVWMWRFYWKAGYLEWRLRTSPAQVCKSAPGLLYNDAIPQVY